MENRYSARTDRLDFQYSVNATSLATGTWTDENELDFTAPNMYRRGAKDGNLAANRIVITFTLLAFQFLMVQHFLSAGLILMQQVQMMV